MFKKGDVVFVVIKFTNTDNSFTIDIRKRILTEPTELCKTGNEPYAWYTTDVEGNSKGSYAELFKTKDEALRTMLERQYDCDFFSKK